MALVSAGGKFFQTAPQTNPTSGLNLNGTWEVQDGQQKQGGQIYVNCSAPFEIAPDHLISPARLVSLDSSGFGIIDFTGIADYTLDSTTKRLAQLSLVGTDDRNQLPYALETGPLNEAAMTMDWNIQQSNLPGAPGRKEVSAVVSQ